VAAVVVVGKRFAVGWTGTGLCFLLGLKKSKQEQSPSALCEAIMTPDEELDHLHAELERFQHEHAGMRGVLRLTDKCLRGCSKWKWEQHGWTITDQQACGIAMTLLLLLKEQVQEVEVAAELDKLSMCSSTSYPPIHHVEGEHHAHDNPPRLAGRGNVLV
jgi:hypothetical protein